MKKIIFAFMVCICMVILSHAQTCEVTKSDKLGIMYPATQINLPEKYYLDISRTKKLDSLTKKFYAMDSSYWAYIPRSDTSIMVFLAKEVVSFFKICSSKGECDSLAHFFYIDNLIVEEFNQLQSVGIFQGSVAEADSLSRYIVKKIRDVYGDSLPLKISFSGAVYTTFKAPKSGDGAGFTNPVSSLCFYDRNGKDLNFCDLIDTVRQCGADFRQESSTSLKPSGYRMVSPGTKYRAFDMNGNLIHDGVWHKNAAAKFRTPTIIRFENGLAVPVYNGKH